MSIKIITVPKKISLRLPSGFTPFDVPHKMATVYQITGGWESWHPPMIAKALANKLLYDVCCITDSGECEGNLDGIRACPLVIEVGYFPGVTDGLASVAAEIINTLFNIKNLEVSTSKMYLIAESLSQERLDIVLASIHNSVIHKLLLDTGEQFADVIIPDLWHRVKHKDHAPSIKRIDLNLDDTELLAISKFGIKDSFGSRGALGLSIGDMRNIAKYCVQRGRDVSDIELETLAQTWSEHCKHRIFNAPIDDIKEGLFDQFIRRATNEIMARKPGFCISVFSDNAGAIAFDDEYLITHKVETHNSPSALEPFGGSITGILGVNRDCLGFGMGAKPIANTYGFCFALPDNLELYRDSACTQSLLDPRKIINDVILGVEVGGNCSGIPTPHGILYYDPSYRGKPLVYVGTIGIIPRKINGKLSHVTQVNDGDLIVMLGGRIGKDGIHGATLSSDAHDGRSNINMVQIGDPYLQKKVSDAVMEIRDKSLLNAITDNGAGGLSSSIGEMGVAGFVVDLEKAPLKDQSMDPWEIWISESQERMTLAVSNDNIEKVKTIATLHGVEVSVLGVFNNSGMAVVRFNGEIIMELDADFLHHGYCKEHLQTEVPAQPNFSNSLESSDIAEDILNLISSPNVCSREKIVRRYDHEVQGTSVLKPIVGPVCTDAAVIRPLLNGRRGIAITSAMRCSNPIFGQDSYFDTYHAAACGIDTAMRNLVAVGADPDEVAILDNFCWRDSKNPKSLWQLKRSAEACYDYATIYGTPFISGKDSMFNDFCGYDADGSAFKISAMPTLLISAISVMEDINKVVSPGFKNPGDLIYVVGQTLDEMGGSEYYRLHNIHNVKVPKVDAQSAMAVYRKIFVAMQSKLIASAISMQCIASAVAKSAMAGVLGCTIDLNAIPTMNECTDSVKLFSETHGRMLLSIQPQNEAHFLKIMTGLPFAQIGIVTDNDINIKCRDKQINITMEKMLKAYQTNSLFVV